ncbi:MAG TPA: hemerythrin family protein [Fibrobacteria bacterium]|nr:hemerythrin family protein [Fibrobacteria bacterium]
MDEIVWTNRLATGVEHIDGQHRALIARLSDLSEAIRMGEAAAVLLESFRFLEIYVREHFQDEETEMERLDCPEAELNRKGHQRFLSTFQALQRRLVGEGPSASLAQEVHHELGEWFMHHILLVDTRMAKIADRLELREA